MTAFARAEAEVQNRHLVWEVKSVNHRYLETNFRLPDGARQIEHRARDLARKHIKRGKLDCTLRIEAIATAPRIEVNRDILLQLMAAIEQVRRDAPEIGGVSPLDLLRWPGVLDDTPTDDDAVLDSAADLFEEALSGLIEARRREGEQLKALVTDRLSAIDGIVTNLKPLTDNLALKQKEKLIQKVAELEVTLDPSRLEQEVALLAQKVDVAEELDRLSIHVEEARSHIQGPGPHGRRLDFLTQELNRESNTLGAKSITAETSQKAVELKVLIEQIREQVQNVE
jgi:uncharacterized protein (TIGR00255 family)